MRNFHLKAIFTLFLMLVLTTYSNDVEAQDSASVDDAKMTSSPSAKISEVAWIAGHWKGEAFGGRFEETWNPPFGGSMMGMFKLVNKDSIGFYELLTIVEHEGSLLLRLKHFDKKLVGWEEKDKSIEFPLLRVSKTEAVFNGLIFKKIDKNEMHILVKINQNGETNEITFVCKRVTK